MRPTVLTGSANPALGAAVAEVLGIPLAGCAVRAFPDGELHVELGAEVRGHDVYLLQPTAPPAERHLVELLLMADACRRAGAGRITAIVPYFGYARQDRRASDREAVGARVMVNLLETARFARLVALDLHSPALEGFFGTPLEHLTAVPVLAERVREGAAHSVIVAPDLGAAKLADHYAGILDAPVAIVHKVRTSGTEVKVRGISGNVRGRRAIIVDDLISTGGTITAAAAALREAGCDREITVVATHALLVGAAVGRLRALPLSRLVVTDSVAPVETGTLSLERVSVAPLLASAVARFHDDLSAADPAPPD
jgi:ribose-phosphate pyrophosphokinase